MKLFYFLLALCSFGTYATPATDKLLEANGAKAYFAKNEGRIAEIVLASRPELAAQKSVVEAWEQQYYAWSKVSEALAPIYSSRFSPQEIAELTKFFKSGQDEAFFNTPTGKKYQQLKPEINADFTKFGYEYMQKVAPYLNDMIKQHKSS
ncbi:hypothetical protein HR45_11285 [Shewanella mangrovi]|uniref:Uncharacterized protein n=1 Tax=Shewanella mangrovi TaxID=1515746 RepID=A0A094JGU4_9GAMM|nr:DUF2059 domain-containing protein [Shewanella mangrovi]KFZ37254.1 hypothetical protein HR45_11285 [Shewanella mangrovi]